MIDYEKTIRLSGAKSNMLIYSCHADGDLLLSQKSENQ